MSVKGKFDPVKPHVSVGIIGHVGHGRTRGMMLAGALAMLATTTPALVHGDSVGKIMDRRRTVMDSGPYTDDKRDRKRARKADLYKDPATRWRT